jgi:hypothetical protein
VDTLKFEVRKYNHEALEDREIVRVPFQIIFVYLIQLGLDSCQPTKKEAACPVIHKSCNAGMS